VNPAGANDALTFTATDTYVGTDGHAITITYVDPSGNDQVLGVVVTDTDIVVNLATGPAGAITSTAADILAAIQASDEASALVTVANTAANDGTGVVTAMAEAPLASGVGSGTTTSAAVGSDITVTLGTNAAGAVTATAADVKTAVEADAGSDALVVVTAYQDDEGIGGNITGVVTDMEATTLAGGAAAVAGAEITLLTTERFEIVGITNAAEIQVKRTDSSDTPVTVQARWAA
jgi:hypothetical protein